MTDEIHTYVIVEIIRELREKIKRARKDPGKTCGLWAHSKKPPLEKIARKIDIAPVQMKTR